MNTFMTYVVLGISLSAPIGPINAAQLDRGARFGFMHAWLVGLGACVPMLSICCLFISDWRIFWTRPLSKPFFGHLAALFSSTQVSRP